MSTNSVIGRKTESGFFARYHHWDGYPSGLGEALFQLYNGHFQKDIKAMTKVLLDEHPAGWSTIEDKDFALEPGWTPFLSHDCGSGELFNHALYDQQLAEYNASDDAKRPQCYCHGGRNEEHYAYSSFSQIMDSWFEYAYILDEQSCVMTIYERDDDDGWRVITEVDLNGTEPDWDKMER